MMYSSQIKSFSLENWEEEATLKKLYGAWKDYIDVPFALVVTGVLILLALLIFI